MGDENHVDIVRVRCMGIKHCSSACLMIGFFQLEEGISNYCGQLCANASFMPGASQRGCRKVETAREGKKIKPKQKIALYLHKNWYMLSAPKCWFCSFALTENEQRTGERYMERWLVASIKGHRNTLIFFSMEKSIKGRDSKMMTSKTNIVNWKWYLLLFIAVQLMEPN